MLKTIKNYLSFRKNSKTNLNITPGEHIRDQIISAGIKTAQEAGYAAGNSTERLVQVASEIGKGIDFGTKLGAGGEAASSLGRITFKAGRDLARGDGVCTGLCTISATCEIIALGCSTIKIIPYRGTIYIYAKIVSKGCMSYRNLCAGEGC
jgi:hypothetical protein